MAYPIGKISNHLLSHGSELLNETDSNSDDISDLECDVEVNTDYSSLSHDSDNELHPLHMFRNTAYIDELANDMLNKSDVSVVLPKVVDVNEGNVGNEIKSDPTVVLQKSIDVNEGNVESISVNVVQQKSQFIDGNAQGVQSSINNGDSDKCDELVMDEMQSVIGDSRIAENDDKVSALGSEVVKNESELAMTKNAISPSQFPDTKSDKKMALSQDESVVLQSNKEGSLISDLKPDTVLIDIKKKEHILIALLKDDSVLVKVTKQPKQIMISKDDSALVQMKKEGKQFCFSKHDSEMSVSKQHSVVLQSKKEECQVATSKGNNNKSVEKSTNATLPQESKDANIRGESLKNCDLSNSKNELSFLAEKHNYASPIFGKGSANVDTSTLVTGKGEAQSEPLDLTQKKKSENPIHSGLNILNKPLVDYSVKVESSD